MFSKEVELADSMQTLFRGNSLASKIMTFCFKVCIIYSVCLYILGLSRRSSIQSVLDWLLFSVPAVWVCVSLCISLGIRCYLPTEATGSFIADCDHIFRLAACQLWSGSYQVCHLHSCSLPAPDSTWGHLNVPVQDNMSLYNQNCPWKYSLLAPTLQYWDYRM